MSLVKTSLLNGIAVSVKVASALVLNKILAVYVGPAGYAIIGQFQNAVSIAVSLAGGLVGSGVTKATAQHFDDEAKQHAIWQSAIRLSFVASLITGVFLLFLGQRLSDWLLHRTDMSSVFVWLALALPAMAANNLLLAIVNGKKEVRIYVTANIIGSLLALSLTGLLAYNFGLYGALVAFTINPAIIMISTTLMVAKRYWFKVQYLWGGIDRAALIELSGFGLMGIASALAMPIAYMMIRDHLASQLGMEVAGYWQASWKISEIYLMLVTTTFAAYYLPRLAEIRSSSELRAELIRVYRFVLPVVMVGAIMMYLLRDFIIQTLFTAQFLPMRELFSWQLAGDVIKIGSWIAGYILIGRGLVKQFVISEIFSAAAFYALSSFLVEPLGVKGVPIAYALTYCICWVLMIFIVLHEMKRMEIRDE